MIDRYIESIRKIEGDALLLHKLQELTDVVEIKKPKKLTRLAEDLAFGDSQSEGYEQPSESKAYNLIMIVNPNPIYEKVCQDFKSQQEQNKNKKILLNKVIPNGDGGYVCNQIRAQTIRETGDRTDFEGEVIGQVVQYSESDTTNHPVEKLMGQWVTEFHNMLSFIAEHPVRYSELRPMYLH